MIKIMIGVIVINLISSVAIFKYYQNEIRLTEAKILISQKSSEIKILSLLEIIKSDIFEERFPWISIKK
jgi:hypothetical protein